MNRRDYTKSNELFARAAKVIPGGIYGHASPAISLPGASPYYAARAEGCRYWDVDGNEFIDFMCGYGPIILGYNHPEVEEAAARQARDGNCFNHPTPLMVELAERLVSLVDFASWSVFGKNGADMTTWCTQVAREHTGAKKILKVAGAYHGSHPWCSPGHGGWIEEDRVARAQFSVERSGGLSRSREKAPRPDRGRDHDRLSSSGLWSIGLSGAGLPAGHPGDLPRRRASSSSSMTCARVSGCTLADRIAFSISSPT